MNFKGSGRSHLRLIVEGSGHGGLYNPPHSYNDSHSGGDIYYFVHNNTVAAGGLSHHLYGAKGGRWGNLRTRRKSKL